MSAFCRFCATKWLNVVFHVHLCRFISQQIWEENFGTEGGVHLIDGVPLTWVRLIQVSLHVPHKIKFNWLPDSASPMMIGHMAIAIALPGFNDLGS